ncbi:MAG: sugar phosphate nucleotidyltransferase [Candidatus Nanoarchaeia archaeon]|nr:sugar phosphate nucleotidyltransferase [Candidatus Nanoarchaeia archaeon]
MDTSLAFILAGGKGDRLAPLTDNRAKPAVPFARYRIVDHNLSAIINAGVPKVLILPQFQPLSLDLHVDKAYPHTDMHLEQIVRMVYPREIRRDEGGTEFTWYKGTAHAVKQNTELIGKYDPNHVLIFAGDHICAIDVADMLEQHHQQRRDLTIAVEVRLLSEDDFETSKSDGQLRYKYGVLDANEDGRISQFREKPLRTEMGAVGEEVLVSMGNYIFHTGPLLDSLELVTEKDNDFGKNVIPEMLRNNRDLFVYRFNGYWRDVGDIVSYYNACMDLNQPNPPLDYKRLRAEKRPVTTEGGNITPSRIESQGKISTVAEGCEIYGKIENCVLGQNVVVGHGSYLKDCVVFPNSVIEPGVSAQNTIIDKNNIIPKGITIGYHQESDRLKQYTVVPRTEGYIVVVPRDKPRKK